MTPYFDDGSCVIYHGDCREIIPSLQSVDAIITDPPYGIGLHNRRGSTGVDPWRDDARPSIAFLLDVGDQHCIWGGNYFTDELPVSESWRIWIKRPDGFNFDNDTRSPAVVEMAWTDFGGKPQMMHHTWDGGMRAGDTSNRAFSHPAQKPLEVMRWCVAGASGQSVVDPFMGSGTTLRAAKDLGRRAVGIEIEERYCEIAAKRLAQEVLAL